MRASPAVAESPTPWLTLPFFMLAPLGLIGGGLLLATAKGDILLAINVPRMVAVTHAIVVGWLSSTIMGATYQLLPAVFGGRLPWMRFVRAHAWLHAATVASFVLALLRWDVALMAGLGSIVVASFAFYLGISLTALARTRPAVGTTRAYMAFSLLFLAATFLLGLTWLGALQHLWFPITMGALSAHAHLGLVGWVTLMMMGVSYQLVPMFNVVHNERPRFAWAALVLTVLSLALFAAVLPLNPGPDVRIGLAVALAAGPALWLADMWRMLARRSRRRLEIHGRALMVSLVALAAAIVAGIAAAAGTPFTPADESARWLLAYGALGVLGFAGCAVVGNSYQIVPFLVWLHRYRSRAGVEPVPLVRDLISARLAYGTLVMLAAGAVLVSGGAIAGSLEVIRGGGALVAAAGAAQLTGLLGTLRPVRTIQAHPLPRGAHA